MCFIYCHHLQYQVITHYSTVLLIDELIVWSIKCDVIFLVLPDQHLADRDKITDNLTF